MATITITTRRTASGPRFVVRYRLGGRAYPVVHAGSRMRDAATSHAWGRSDSGRRRDPNMVFPPSTRVAGSSHRRGESG